MNPMRLQFPECLSSGPEQRVIWVEVQSAVIAVKSGPAGLWSWLSAQILALVTMAVQMNYRFLHPDSVAALLPACAVFLLLLLPDYSIRSRPATRGKKSLLTKLLEKCCHRRL